MNQEISLFFNHKFYSYITIYRMHYIEEEGFKIQYLHVSIGVDY